MRSVRSTSSFIPPPDIAPDLPSWLHCGVDCAACNISLASCGVECAADSVEQRRVFKSSASVFLDLYACPQLY